MLRGCKHEGGCAGTASLRVLGDGLAPVGCDPTGSQRHHVAATAPGDGHKPFSQFLPLCRLGKVRRAENVQRTNRECHQFGRGPAYWPESKGPSKLLSSHRALEFYRRIAWQTCPETSLLNYTPSPSSDNPFGFAMRTFICNASYQ